MPKSTIISIALCLYFSVLGLAMAKNHSVDNSRLANKIVSKKNLVLKDWSIVPKWKPKKQLTYSMDWKPKKNNLRNLVNQETKNVVAVIQTKSDGSVILNPRDQLGGGLIYDYGPIPNLNEFTVETAETLFGKNLSKTKSKTFALKIKGTNEYCYIDMWFSKNKLNKYRVRMPDKELNRFISVN